MFVKSIDQLKKVSKSELCSRCGSCVGLSNGKIQFSNKEAEYLPRILKPLTDDEADRIWQACPGKYFSFPEHKEYLFPDAPHDHSYTGAYHQIYIGHATDPEIRSKGASGGIISAVLIYLLEKNKIQGVVCLRMSKTKPWLTEPFIATTKDEVIEAAQSKYIISSVNELLPEIEKFDGRLAFVGIPPQIQSIRKLQKMGDPSVANIHIVLGPFYGNTLYFSSVKSFLKTHGVRNYKDITKLYFRYGEWPGNMRVEMKDGQVFSLKKFHANYLIPFHILKNSLYCTDFTNEFTDISGGDAWAPKYEERGKGFSMVLSRSKKGENILQQMITDGWLELHSISEEEAIKMHSHGYDFKKRGSFIRIKFRKLSGKSVPDYGYEIKGFGISRYMMEMVIHILFVVLGTPLARWTVEQIPPKTVGNIFEKARTIWKKSTHRVKRKKLND